MVKFVLVLGVVSAVVAIGLAYGIALLTGGKVAPEEIPRYVIIAFVIAVSVALILRHQRSR